MKYSLPSISTLFSLAALAATFSGLSAQVTTDPVGYVTTTTPSGDDTLIGLPLERSTELSGTAVSVTGAQIAVASTLVADAYNNTHYVLATSGANEGQWSEVVATATDSITTAEVLLATADTFKVVPFWTLGTAFVGGEGVGASADPFSPELTVLINDLTAEGINPSPVATYFYYAGPSPAAGWYQTGTFAVSDDVRLSPETYVTIRNNSGSAINTTITGVVPTDVSGTLVVGTISASQDNLLVNPYPAPITLATSGLNNVVADAENPYSPLDTVLIYDIEGSTGQNISVAATYFYFAGPSPAAGWYQTGTFAPSDNVEIPAGGAFVVRKGPGDNEGVAWNPPLPYSL